MADVANIICGAAITTAFHPVTYAKVLIQLGHEPLEQMVSTSLFTGKPYSYYPHVFSYANYLRKREGFFGVYAGLGSRLAGGIINQIVSTQVSKALIPSRPADKEEGEIDDDDERDGFVPQVKKLVTDCAVESAQRTVGMVASHPFHVIMVRTMAQFVGREMKYGFAPTSLLLIYSEEGFSGLFAGLVPRLAAEVLTIWISNILAVTLTNMCPREFQSKDVKKNTHFICSLVVSQFIYPLTLVANVMAGNNCGLALGKPPLTRVFSSWQECFSHLSRFEQLKRGSSMFFRYCVNHADSATTFYF